MAKYMSLTLARTEAKAVTIDAELCWSRSVLVEDRDVQTSASVVLASSRRFCVSCARSSKFSRSFFARSNFDCVSVSWSFASAAFSASCFLSRELCLAARISLVTPKTKAIVKQNSEIHPRGEILSMRRCSPSRHVFPPKAASVAIVLISKSATLRAVVIGYGFGIHVLYSIEQANAVKPLAWSLNIKPRSQQYERIWSSVSTRMRLEPPFCFRSPSRAESSISPAQVTVPAMAIPEEIAPGSVIADCRIDNSWAQVSIGANRPMRSLSRPYARLLPRSAFIRSCVSYRRCCASAIQATASAPAAIRSGADESLATRQIASETSLAWVTGPELSRMLDRTRSIIGA